MLATAVLGLALGLVTPPQALLARPTPGRFTSNGWSGHAVDRG